MNEGYHVILRYFPGDLPLDFDDTRLVTLASEYGLELTLDRRENHNAKKVAGRVVEETLGVSFEQISQTVISVAATGPDGLRAFLREFFRRYQSPRPSFGLWGSNAAGEALARQVAAFYD